MLRHGGDPLGWQLIELTKSVIHCLHESCNVVTQADITIKPVNGHGAQANPNFTPVKVWSC